MAALVMKQDTATGIMKLSPSIMPRLTSLLFGLVWLGFLGVFLAPAFAGDNPDWETILFIAVFALLPIGSSFVGALMTNAVTLDPGSRTLKSVKQFLFVPVSSVTVPFSDITNIDVQYVKRSSRNSSNYFSVNAATRDGKRIALNWNGSQGEMQDLAQRVSVMTGVPLAEQPYKAPGMVQQVLEQVAPELEQMIEPSNPPAQPADSTPMGKSMMPSAAPVMPKVNELSGTDMPSSAPMMSDAYAENTLADTEPAPARDLSALSLNELEQRVGGDPMDSEARYALARQYFSRGQLDRAMGMYQEVMRLDPTNAGAQNDIGIVLQARGKRTEAEAAYRRAIALDPFSSTPHLNLGLLLRQMKRPVDASQEFLQARQNARGDMETRAAESAPTNTKMEPVLSRM
jgi:tetratricopeptide (TPR) repeat protein